MVSTISSDTWVRKGISLLWDASKLSSITNVQSILSVRQFLSFYKTEWPDELLSANGYAMIVSGLDTLIDVMEPEEIIDWLENNFYRALLSFQSMYEGQCSLIFWIPDGQKRLEQKADGIYYWNCSGPYNGIQIPLSRCLWNGAAIDAKLIINNQNSFDLNDKNCIGIYHPRIS
ncbi:hypothetical protein [Ureibacillus sinduriensis]|uniref:hypothetical protein n=1 Tax=Ureibacillus sinduriensis TaxID=561440 RepID=UPI00068E2344|nr:hypothetical protein [Ureibacillus sinduriensis]